MTEPSKINPSKIKPLPPSISYESLVKELTEAHSAVGELRGLLSTLPDPRILIAPFRKREAVASSAIEGTRATIEEVLEYEATEESKKTPEEEERTRKIQDIREIRNYELAMEVALEQLKTRPIGENVLKKTHSRLLHSVCGENKNRGNFRTEQVRVGEYVPPVHTEIPSLMSNWEKYLNSKDIEEDPLVRIGVAHYQFEAIHPFSDGNGRIGRLIIPLFLCQEDVLQAPVLYVSHFLEKNKVQYQNLLHRIDTHQEWIPWLKFFLVAVKTQAKMTASMAVEILDLYKALKDNVVENIRSQYSIAILDVIFATPILSASEIKSAIKAKSKATTYNLIRKFIERGILREVEIGGKEKIYVCSDLMNIIRRQ